VTIGGGQVDRNRTSLADYGQVKWDSAAAAPMPASNPSAASGSLEQLASAVQHGDYGNGDARKAKLGAKYTAVMAIVNERARVTSAKQSHETLANEAIAGRLGNGNERERLLGTYAKAVQAIINSKLGAPAKTTPAPAPAATYTVKPGDTLSGIAAAHHTTWQALAAKNRISNPNLIHPGQTITTLKGSIMNEPESQSEYNSESLAALAQETTTSQTLAQWAKAAAVRAIKTAAQVRHRHHPRERRHHRQRRLDHGSRNRRAGRRHQPAHQRLRHPRSQRRSQHQTNHQQISMHVNQNPIAPHFPWEVRGDSLC
jgi:LysM repeat protein